MRKILLIGAGRSTSSLIKYLLDNSAKENWHIKVADQSLELAKSKIGDSANAEAIAFDVNDKFSRMHLIHEADIVISMLPANMHFTVARDCVGMKKNMVTASYISPEMKELDKIAKKADILIMNEIGVDPGIDHMSAVQMLNNIRNSGGEIIQFESFTGGLLAPESEKENPWKYKFTWNPRNVVLAGQGSAVKFIQEGKYKYIPYHRLFKRTEPIEIDGFGKFEGYGNRDSLKYREVYGLQDVPTIYRGTLRRPGFCRAWDTFVQLGATDDSYVMENSENLTARQFINSFLVYNPHDSVELKLMHYMKLDQDSDILDKLEWLDIFEERPVGLKNATPAQILQEILHRKWKLDPDDKDMLVMWHKIGYKINGEKKQKESSMVVIGDNQDFTAMAKTVGLPVGIATKLILNDKIKQKGIQLPVSKEVYEPVLKELEEFDIKFIEKDTEYKGY